MEDLEKLQILPLHLKYEKDLWTPDLVLANAVLSEKSSLSNINVLTKGLDELYFSTNGEFR